MFQWLQYILPWPYHTGCTQKSEDVGSLMSAFFFGAKSPPVSRWFDGKAQEGGPALLVCCTSCANTNFMFCKKGDGTWLSSVLRKHKAISYNYKAEFPRGWGIGCFRSGSECTTFLDCWLRLASKDFLHYRERNVWYFSCTIGRNMKYMRWYTIRMRI